MCSCDWATVQRTTESANSGKTITINVNFTYSVSAHLSNTLFAMFVFWCLMWPTWTTHLYKLLLVQAFLDPILSYFWLGLVLNRDWYSLWSKIKNMIWNVQIVQQHSSEVVNVNVPVKCFSISWMDWRKFLFRNIGFLRSINACCMWLSVLCADWPFWVRVICLQSSQLKFSMHSDTHSVMMMYHHEVKIFSPSNTLFTCPTNNLWVSIAV